MNNPEQPNGAGFPSAPVVSRGEFLRAGRGAFPTAVLAMILSARLCWAQDPPPPESPAKSTPPPATAPAPAANPAPGSTGGTTRASDRGDKSLRLNFRGVGLDMVLNYLSEAAGFIIILDTEVKGKVDVWSNQPVSQEEALSILNSALSKNGYAAIRNDRTLTIVSKEEAKKRDLPVKSGSDPLNIPKNDEMVTQIVPVRFINAVQLTKDLQPLLPSQATMTANESGNALVITDTQVNIRRLAEIVRALDTSVSSVSMIRVFPLRFADAKEVATVIKDLFPAQTGGNTGNNNNGGGGGGRFGGFGGGNPFGGAGGGGGNNNAGGNGTNGRPGASRVIASADERSNSLVVSAPDDVMPSIADLVASVDTTVEDITELRVFRLKNADPGEVASMLSDLFPDETRTTDNSRQQIRFGGGPFGGFGNNNNNNAANSDRTKKKGRVLAVSDPRTASVVVSASRDLMTQISQMIEQLDANPARRQKVFVYSLENADVQEVEQILRGMFERTTSQLNRNNTTQTSPLTTRSSSQNNSQSTSRTSVGSGSGIGSSSGGFGGRTSP